MSKLEFRDFTCYYKQKKNFISALEHIDLTVESGEFLAVVGQTGSGKTTLLRACLGFHRYYEGDLLIDGVPVEQVNARKGNVSYVKQEFALYPGMTVYENIAFPLRMQHTPQDQVDRQVREMAELVDISLLLTRKPKQLSGGQLQRVAIARALVKNPRIVYFDEPFGNLDPVLRVELRSLLKKIHRQLRPTVLFVTHDLQEAFQLADRIAVLEEGRLVEIGAPDALEHTSALLKSWFEA